MARPSLIARFPEYQDRFRADILQELYRNERSAMAGHLLVAVLSVGFIWGELPLLVDVTWIGAVVFGVSTRGVLYWRYQRQARPGTHDLHLHTLGIGACALAWSLGFVFASPYLDSSQMAFFMMVFAGINASAVVTLSGRVKSYNTFSLLILGPPILVMLFGPRPDVAIATMAFAMLVFCAVGVRKANQMLQAAMFRRYQNTDIMRDLTQAKKHLEQEARRAEAANVAKQEFLANVSHEIRTPMNGMLGMTDLVLQSELTEDQRECLDTAQRCGRSLLTLIDDLLDFSKIEAGKMEVESIPLEPADLAEDLTTLHRSSGRAKVPVNLELDPDLPARMLGDPVRLRQVLNNLLSNAVKFTSQGSIRLRLLVKGEARDELEVRVEDDGIGIPADRLETIFESFTQADGSTTRNFGGTGLGLTISRSLCELMQGGLEVESEEGRGSTFIVRLPLVDPDRDRLSVPCCMLLLGDTGSSLAPLLDRLQVPYRALAIDDELWNEGRGFLSRQDDLRRLAVVDAGAAREEPELVRAFARHFQVELVWTGSGAAGSAAAEDEAVLPSQVDLPALESLLAREAVALAPDAADEDQAEPTGLRILVAEDHPTNATIVRRMLEALGHEVTLAADGKLAFESFREHGADLVLMDLQMPVMGGHEATKAIRALGDGDRVPIVALTAHAAAEERDRSLAVGMNDLLNKPFTREQLTEVLRTWGRRRARS